MNERFAVDFVPLTQNAWMIFHGWHVNRGISPVMPKHAIMLAERETGELIGGLCLYPTDGVFLVAEHLAIEPALGPKQRLQVYDLIIRALLTYCAMTSKVPIALPNMKGMLPTLRRRGFQPSPAVAAMVREPVAPAGWIGDKKKAPLVAQGGPHSTPTTPTEKPSLPKRSAKSKPKK